MSDLNVDQITDHIKKTLARIAGTLVGKGRFESLVTVFATEIQTLEDTFFEVLTERSLTAEFTGKRAVGEQLDGIGRILGLSRYTSQTDVEYRLDLKAWIRFILSQGEADTLIFVIKALTDSIDVRLSECFPAAIILYFDGAVLNAENLSSIMDRCAAAGIRVDLVNTSTDSFRFDTAGVGYDEGLYASTLAGE